jgi:hypothetical protein
LSVPEVELAEALSAQTFFDAAAAAAANGDAHAADRAPRQALAV